MKMSNLFTRLKKFGIKRIICYYDFIISLILVFLVILLIRDKVLSGETIDQMLNVVISVSITLATLILAGFSLIVSFTDINFIKFLKKAEVYENILFNFEFVIYVAFITFILATVTKIIYFNEYIYLSIFFLFPYLILTTLSLISYITTYGIKRSEFVEAIEKK